MKNKLAIHALVLLGIAITVSACSGPKTDSWISEITKLGVSTKDDFQRFKDDGGLNVHSAWRGYNVESISTEYSGGTLSFLQAALSKNYKDSNGVDPSINNVRQSFAEECGDQWVEQGEGGYQNSDSHPIRCEVSSLQSGYKTTLVMWIPSGE
jgi:hypothetical protein